MEQMQLPEIGSVWTHDKTGNLYTVEMISNVGTTKPDDFPVTVIYRSFETDDLWSRPVAEWHRSMSINKHLGRRHD